MSLHEEIISAQRGAYKDTGIRNYIRERVEAIANQMRNEGRNHERQTLLEVRLELMAAIQAIEERVNEL